MNLPARCLVCGEWLLPGNRICRNCGHDTRQDAPSASPAVEAVTPVAPVLDEPAVPFALEKSQDLREYEACQLIMSLMIAEGKHSTASFRVLWALSEQIKNKHEGKVPTE
jgi:hypothetical protein